MKNLTIDQMLEIVVRAPEGATLCFCFSKTFENRVDYYKHFFNFFQMWLPDHGWFPVHLDLAEDSILLDDLRAAIAEHDQNLSEQRERFEKAYSLKFPKSKVTLLPSGNYSGWIKQKKWKDWQVKEAQLQSELDCDHDWEDISTTADLERQLICTYCGLERSEPLELNAQRWTDGGGF